MAIGLMGSVIVDLGLYLGGEVDYNEGQRIRESALLAKLEKCSEKIILLMGDRVININKGFIEGLFGDVSGSIDLSNKYRIVATDSILEKIEDLVDGVVE